MRYTDSDGRTVKVGDQLVRDDGLYEHHALYAGNGNVLEYAVDPDVLRFGNPMKAYRVQERPLETFQARSDGEFLIGRRACNPEEAVAAARARLGETDYNIFSNNCQTLVDGALTGKKGRSDGIADWLEDSVVAEKAGDAAFAIALAVAAAKQRLTPGALL